MKKILSLIITLSMVGCSDLLEEKPKSLAAETFYNTPAEVESAIFAIYAPLKAPNALGGLYPAQHEAQVDYGYGRGSYTIITDFQGLNSANITRIGQMWDLFYQAIRNANIVIASIPNGQNLTQEQKDIYTAEAKFMRAFTYFILVRNWGGVIIRTEENMAEPDVDRSSASDVYNLIEQDLLFAQQYLPETAPQPGRATKWAAKTMLADVYLNLEKFAEAKSLAEEVLDINKYSLVTVENSEDFLKLFGPDVISTTEEIFSLKYSRQSNQGYNLVMFAHHPGAKYHGAGGYYAHYSDTVKNSFIKDWDINDLRKKYNLYYYNIGLGQTTVLNRKYIDPLASNANSAGNDYPVYRLADLLLLHAEAAARASGAPTAEAVESLNKVHRRAYGFSPNEPSPVDFNVNDFSLQSFISTVATERAYETMYEGKRWLDLKRLGVAKEVIKAVHNKDVADKHLLWPIPTSEINYNRALDPTSDQNPGY